MAHDCDTEHIIDLIYEGITEAGAIEDAIRRCIARLNASGGNIQVTSKTKFETLYFAGFGDGYTESTITKYLDHWQYANAHRDAMRRAYQEDPNRVFLCHEHISERDFQTGAFFQDFFSAIGQRWLIGGLARNSQGTEVSMAFSRRQGDTQFGAGEAEFLSTIMPHVRRATGVAIKLGLPVGKPLPTLAGRMGRSSTPTLLIDGRGTVHWQNNAATDLLSEDCGVALVDGKLSLNDKRANAQLLEAAGTALNQRLAATPSTTVSIKSKSGSIDFEVVPATMPKDSLIGAVSLVVVMIRRAGLSSVTHLKLREEHGLTNAESGLAVLMAEGITIDEAAARRNVSPHTVRTQLRSIFAKTGVNQQAALTALVWRTS